jgi:hypothetical protein
LRRDAKADAERLQHVAGRLWQIICGRVACTQQQRKVPVGAMAALKGDPHECFRATASNPSGRAHQQRRASHRGTIIGGEAHQECCRILHAAQPKLQGHEQPANTCCVRWVEVEGTR